MLVLFCKLISLILGQNCMKDVKVTKIANEIKLEVVWGELEAKKQLFPETMIHKKLQTNSSFHIKERTTGKV